MTSTDPYLLKAVRFEAIAHSQTDPKLRAEFAVIAAGYRRLAGMAERERIQALASLAWSTPGKTGS